MPEVTALDIAFGNIGHLPKWEDIPEKFKNANRLIPETKLISDWFFKGLKEEQIAKLTPKPGVDKNKALIAIQCILRSFEPKHEHKEAGAAFMVSEWFEEFKWE
ncbi:MAG: hypothetical protein HQK96_06985 [Nitrospirae bacterium]|nr:hypothetical protein [Nitrospirota bacterium]